MDCFVNSQNEWHMRKFIIDNELKFPLIIIFKIFCIKRNKHETQMLNVMNIFFLFFSMINRRKAKRISQNWKKNNADICIFP